ncbi:MarR family winged helix-turn-helix transcriptional regulator [Roseomonas sp. BN140053]|uniref:MarR family winged helix-turn-helix transcriptional regulator n=1 Tax=Roseomonas sp. BN140053 TaxID=3391898 RepID=UPI0039E7CB23
MPGTMRTMYLLRQAQLASYARLEAALAGFGLTPTQYTALSLSDRPGEGGEERAEGQAGSGPSSAELARRLGVTAQAMNEMIAALERKGLIRRREAAENRRILRISLTAEGTALLARCDAVVDGVEQEFLGVLAGGELDALRGTLVRLVRVAADPLPGG